MYTMEEFIKDCMGLEDEELISIALDNNYIITATHLVYIEGCEDEVQLELCSGHTEDGCNVCEDLIETTWANQKNESDIQAAIEFLKLHI